MSDILIKNMKMPKDCLHCGFSHMASDCLKIWIICKPKDISVTDGDAVKDGRPDWCPLIDVQSHGRLIDADALIKEMDKKENAMYEHGHEFSFSFKSGGDVCTAWYNVEMMVEDAPTIIGAEGGT